MLIAIVAGCAVGAVWPGASCLEPLGTVFINMMFCVAAPMVFCSISSAIANMKGVRRAGKIMGATLLTFLVTAAIAAAAMYAVCRAIPLATVAYDPPEGDVGSVSAADMIVSFFTVPDFAALWSRKAMLPLIVAAIIFGFAVQWAGGAETPAARLLSNLTECMLKAVKIVTCYAPIGFFGFFAYLAALYGPQLISDYSRTLAVYYVMCFVYMFASFPLYARFGGGRGGAKVMFRHLFRPAAVSFGACSSVAMSGIPGGGGVGELVICTIFFPNQMEIAYPVAIALGNLVDPPAAMVNAVGDYVVSFIVSRFVDGRDWLQKKLNAEKAEGTL